MTVNTHTSLSPVANSGKLSLESFIEQACEKITEILSHTISEEQKKIRTMFVSFFDSALLHKNIHNQS